MIGYVKNMTPKVAINGFGRIGRCIVRAAWGTRSLDVVAINEVASEPRTMAHLLKYDSTHGTWNADVRPVEGGMAVDGKSIPFFSIPKPEELPWKKLGVDIVMECTGRFTEREKAAGHLSAGARKVIISAPSKNPDATLCMGVNEKAYDSASHNVISNASCTTNCLAPVAKVLNDGFGIDHGFMTTVHSYTNDQRILDLHHKDLRRSRAAALNMIITTTGAARAVGLVLPELKGKLDGVSIRVPTPNVSLVDLTAEVKKTATKEEVNAAFLKASQGPLKGILEYCSEELVSSDFNMNPHSAIFDALSTMVVEERSIKVFAWYDNEWGFSNRMVDLALYISKNGF